LLLHDDVRAYLRHERASLPRHLLRNVEQAARFYEDWLGFEVQVRLPPEGEPGYVGMTRGEAELAIVAADWPADQLGMTVGDGPRFELFAYVEDVDALIGQLADAGAPVLREPQDMPWGERVAYVADPDGNPVALASALG
jgi:lactoylglutathione lyase